MKEKKYKYNVVNKYGRQEAWTGVFNSKKLADEWFLKHGIHHQARGYKLVLVKLKSNSKEE